MIADLAVVGGDAREFWAADLAEGFVVIDAEEGNFARDGDVGL